METYFKNTNQQNSRLNIAIGDTANDLSNFLNLGRIFPTIFEMLL